MTKIDGDFCPKFDPLTIGDKRLHEDFVHIGLPYVCCKSGWAIGNFPHDLPDTEFPTKPPFFTFRKLPNLHQLIVNTGLCPLFPAGPTSSQTFNTPHRRTCPMHHPLNSFTSSCNNFSYPNTILNGGKPSKIIHNLQCTDCDAFILEKPAAPF